MRKGILEFFPEHHFKPNCARCWRAYGRSRFFIALGAIVAGFVEGLSGLAFSLVAISFWAWTVEPKLAAALAVFGGLSGQIIAALTVRRGFDLRLLLPFLIGGIAGIPLALSFGGARCDWFKALLGALLIVWCPLMLFAWRLPRVPDGGSFAMGFPAFWEVYAGDSADLPGYPDVVVQLARNGKAYTAQHHREFQSNDLASTMAAYLATGAVTREMLPMFAIVAPAMPSWRCSAVAFTSA